MTARRSLLLLAMVTSCAAPTAPPNVLGEWGGTQASLSLSTAGGTVAYACGAGTIAAGWTLAADGTFNATGTHAFGGGPVPIGGRPPHPARYNGRVDGDVLTMTVTITDLAQTIGPLRLVRGGPVVHELCL